MQLSRARIGLRLYLCLAVFSSTPPLSALAQGYRDDPYKSPPMPPQESCKLAPVLSVDHAEIHGIRGDRAILTAHGTADDDQWRYEELKLVGTHNATAIYDFVACPAPEKPNNKRYFGFAFTGIIIRNVHRIIIRATTDQAVIDVDVARRLPDPWSRPAPPPIRSQ